MSGESSYWSPVLLNASISRSLSSEVLKNILQARLITVRLAIWSGNSLCTLCLGFRLFAQDFWI